jgi:hypothetical protein
MTGYPEYQYLWPYGIWIRVAHYFAGSTGQEPFWYFEAQEREGK